MGAALFLCLLRIVLAFSAECGMMDRLRSRCGMQTDGLGRNVMLYLLLAIISSALVSVTMRLSAGKVAGNTAMLAVNYMTCLAMAAYHSGWNGEILQAPGLGAAVAMGAVNGFFYLSGFVLLQRSVRENGVVLSSVFMKLGLLVPMTVSVVLFREMPSVIQGIGFCVAVTAIVLINWEKGGAGKKVGAGLILLLLTGGAGDAMCKIFEELGEPALSEFFLFCTFGTALVLCFCLVVKKRERIGLREMAYGLLVGIPNFFSAQFLLRALESLPAVIVYPSFSVSTILVVTLAGVCFFRERLKVRQWAALGMILLALALLNL